MQMTLKYDHFHIFDLDSKIIQHLLHELFPWKTSAIFIIIPHIIKKSILLFKDNHMT
jgi:hypothetical protein